MFTIRSFQPCRSPEEGSGGADASQSPAKSEKATAHVRAAYPVKAPEGRVTRRADAALPARRMPGTDKQVSTGAEKPVERTLPLASSDTATGSTVAPMIVQSTQNKATDTSKGNVDTEIPTSPAAEVKAKPAVAPAAVSKTESELAVAKEAAKQAARQAARDAMAKAEDLASRATERMTREQMQARQQAKPPTARPVTTEKPIQSVTGKPASSNESGPLRPFSRGVKASEAPTMPPHRATPPAPPAGRPVPTSGAFPPARPSIPVARFDAGEETEVKGNVEPITPDNPVSESALISPLEETQPMDPAEVEVPVSLEGDGESPRISFGQAALMLKLVTAAQIQECVNIQRMQMSKGQRVSLLGQILQERSYIDKAGIDKVKSHQQVFQFGTKIPGYQIFEKLGQGAMGAVFKAKQLRMERWVAIKILQPELAANPTIKQRFLQEARASARLNHPNVIVGIDAGEVGGLSYFAMEYVEGKTLQQLVKERGPMDERQALEVIVQVARALEHAEKHSLVHRDIKPDNIMVTRERVAKLLDLGLAKMRAEGDIGASKGMAVGTPNYISPEQAMGRSDIDTRADIYSLGVTLFYVLTGRVPFEGPPEVVMYRHIHEPPPHPKNFRPDLSDSVSTLIFTMLAKRPEDRQASAGQVVSDIDHLLRTGKLPGLFDSKPGGSGPLKLNKGGSLVPVKKRLPNLHGYGMPGVTPPPPTHQAPQQQPPGQEDPNAPRLPRKRRKRFGSGW